MNYRVDVPGKGSGESSGEFFLASPLTRGDQVVELCQIINNSLYGGGSTVAVRTFQLLREV
ncbi:hypothetical protein FDN03_15510 [Glutamicibacter sp. V16R2B1]|nr:hypothetical protein FDN03_15510 [Glutamicibacter sp. V16R2B1]